MHLHIFPMYALTCGAHNSTPLLNWDVGIHSFASPTSSLQGCDLYAEMPAAGISVQPDV